MNFIMIVWTYTAFWSLFCEVFVIFTKWIFGVVRNEPYCILSAAISVKLLTLEKSKIYSLELPKRDVWFDIY